MNPVFSSTWGHVLRASSRERDPEGASLSVLEPFWRACAAQVLVLRVHLQLPAVEARGALGAVPARARRHGRRGARPFGGGRLVVRDGSPTPRRGPGRVGRGRVPLPRRLPEPGPQKGASMSLQLESLAICGIRKSIHPTRT